MFLTQKMAHTTKEDLSVLSWVRAALAPLDAVGIHCRILAQSHLHDASSDRLLPGAPGYTFCPTWENMTQTA